MANYDQLSGGETQQANPFATTRDDNNPLVSLFIPILLLLGVIRLILSGILNLIPDEAYYWSWSRDISLCYYDQPGMIAYIEYLFTKLPGLVSAFSARLPMVLLSLGGSFLLYAISRDIFGDKRRAVLTVLIMNVTPIFWGGSFMVMHDGPLVFFWIATVWLVARFQVTQHRLYLYFAALSLSAAMYSKFSGVFLIPGVVLYFLLSPNQRKWLRRWDIYVCGLLIVLLFSPVLWWNSQNDWVAYKAVQKLGHRDNIAFSKHLDYFFSYHGASVLIISPLIYISMIGSLWLGIKRWWRSTRDDATLLCLCFSVPALLYFSYLTFNTRVQPNWSAMGYPLAILLMVEEVGRRFGDISLKNRLFYSRGYWRVAVGIAMFISLALTLQAAFHIIPTPEKWIRKDRIYDEFYGWEELGERVAEERRPGEVMMALRYQVASELEFYVPGNPQIYCMNAFGRGNHYDFRNDYNALNGQNVLIVAQKPIPDVLANKFQRLEEPVSLDISHRGIIIKSFLLYHGQKFDSESAPSLADRRNI